MGAWHADDQPAVTDTCHRAGWDVLILHAQNAEYERKVNRIFTSADARGFSKSARRSRSQRAAVTCARLGG
jgi:hypothetical protein